MMRAGIGEFLHSMAGLPPPLLVIVREKTGARQGPRNGRRSLAVQMMPGSALFRGQQAIHEISAGKARPHGGKAAKKADKFRALLRCQSPELFFLDDLQANVPRLRALRVQNFLFSAALSVSFLNQSVMARIPAGLRNLAAEAKNFGTS